MNSLIKAQYKNNTYIMIQIGKLMTEKCYKVDLEEDNFMNLVEQLSTHVEFDKIDINDEKHYYSGDMRLVVDIEGEMKCIKYKYNSYDIYETDKYDVRIINYSFNHINPDFFSGTTEYNDIRRLNKITFYKNNVVIDMKIITYLDKYITYEFDMYTKSDNYSNMVELYNEIFGDGNFTKKISREFSNNNRISKTIH